MIAALALRNALRNRRRSLLTATMVTLGVACLTVAMAWIEGVLGSTLDAAANNAGHVRVVSPEYARREQLNPIDRNLPDTAALEAALRAVPGVTGVYPRISMGVTATVGEEIGEEFGLVQGAPLGWFEGPLQLPGHLSAGRMLAADDEAVIGKKLVEKIGARLGDEVVILGLTQDGSMSPARVKLVGIADLGTAMQNRQVFLTLEKVRYLADIPDGAVEIAVYGDDRAGARALAAAVAALPATHDLDVRSWDQRPPFDSILGLIGTVHGVSAAVMVFITGLGVLNTMLMSVLERTGEIGVLRAMGLRKSQVVALFVLEALGIAAIGGVLGAVLGGLGGLALQVHGVDLGSMVDKMPSNIPLNSVVHAKVTPGILVSAVLLGLSMAVVGGIIPALRAARIEPIEAMRHRREERPMLRAFLTLIVALLPMVARAATVEDILAKVDANMTFDSRASTLRMTVTKGERVKVYRMQSYGRGADDAAVEYLEPARDKGTKMLKSATDLWMWLPAVEKTQKISGHMLRQSMMGSDMSYEDMMQASAWRRQYAGTVLGEETVDGRKAWKLELKATTPDVSYPRRLVWVDEATNIPVRQDLYALSGMLLKTWTMSDIKDFGGRQFPTRMVVEDKVQQGSRTELVFEAIQFSVPLEAEVFSMRWLER